MTEAGQVVSGNPIINDPFAEPTRHWHFSGLVPEIREGRRTAGYLAASPDGELKITDEIIGFEVVNDIRDRVRTWREEGYPGATVLTRDLLRHWFDDERRLNNTRPFFCQQEAVETIVFLTEAPADRKVGISVPPSGEAYTRWAVKMATGSGKTLVMALIAAWSGLNKVANRQDPRFSDQILVVSPNITVRDRLVGAGGLDPKHAESVFAEFDLIPPQYSGLMGQFHLQVMNWHQLAPKEDPKRSVVRRGRESDAAFCRRVLDGLVAVGAGAGAQRRGPPRLPLPRGHRGGSGRTPTRCARPPCGSTASSASTGTERSSAPSTARPRRCSRVRSRSTPGRRSRGSSATSP